MLYYNQNNNAASYLCDLIPQKKDQSTTVYSLMMFWRKIVVFHTKYPKIFRASLRNWKGYDCLA
jgi:hypothetical protein